MSLMARTPGTGAVTSAFVHEQHQVRQLGEVIEIAVAQILDSRLMRGLLPPRTSELILEMLKMFTVTGESRLRVPARCS